MYLNNYSFTNESKYFIFVVKSITKYMIVQDVINHLEELAPLAYAEDFDNVGLLVGDKNSNLQVF